MSNPTTRDVARYLRARTRTTFGEEVGDFTADTTPTGEQAMELIQDAAAEISEALGSDIPDDLQASANRLIVLLAAANIEMSYFPEQAAQRNSMYDKLMARYTTLRASMEVDEGEEFVDNDMEPSFDFPTAYGWGGVTW